MVNETSKQIFDNFIKKNNILYTRTGYRFLSDNKMKLLSWDNAKNDNVFIVKFNKFRKLYVDTLLSEILNNLKCLPDCHIESSGSTSVDSDYDITVYSEYTSKIVEEFNHRFLHDFKKESSYIFDTNLYGTSFFHTQNSYNYDYIIKDSHLKCEPSNFIFYLNLNGNKTDIINQHIWSFIKVFMHINKVKPVTIRNKLIATIKANCNDESILNIISKSRTKFNKLIKAKTSYIKELKKYDVIKSQYDSKNIKDIDIGIQLKEQTSVTNFYSRETYLTQGAVNHVVGKLQLKYKHIYISKDEYLDSILDNLGDIIKEYNIYKNDYIHFCLYSGKYIYRIMDAIINIDNKNRKYYKLRVIGDLFRKYRNHDDDILHITNAINRFNKILKFSELNSLSILQSIIKHTMIFYTKHY